MIKCLIVDDERLAQELLEDNLKQIPFLEHVASCRNAVEASAILSTRQVDLIFLDIQMPGLSGLQFVNSLANMPMVIFVTAYEKYALQGFNLDVLDYLVKPVPFERFFKAANKAYRHYQLKHVSTEPRLQDQEYLFVNADYSLIRVNIPEILYIEGLKDYVKIYLENNERPVITRLSMRHMEEKLPAAKFMRVHRSFIISLAKITAFRKNRLFLSESEIPVSDSAREMLLSYMGCQLE